MATLYRYFKDLWKLAVVALVLAAIKQIFSLLDPLIFRHIIDSYATRYREYSSPQFIRGVGLLLAAAVYDRPVGQNRKFLSHTNHFSDLAFGGWAISTVSLWETGPYLTPITSSSYDPGNLNLSYRGAFQRPDCIGNGNVATSGSMFNINGFDPIPSRAVGNCGVGILLDPGTSTIAAGLAKNVHLTERFRLRFEATFTNLINHPNFAPPPTNVTASSFGVVQSAQTAENSGNRTGQISLRLDF
jgi:hypothetical protein